jgi:hypothetical protein
MAGVAHQRLDVVGGQSHRVANTGTRGLRSAYREDRHGQPPGPALFVLGAREPNARYSRKLPCKARRWRVCRCSTSVFAEADLIVKVKEPQPAEVAMLEGRHALFTYLHLAPDAKLPAGPPRQRRDVHRL